MAFSLFSRSKDLPKAKARFADGFCDIDFVVTNIEELGGGSIRIVANNLLEKQEVYISLVFAGSWKEKPIENTNGSFYWGSGLLETTDGRFQSFVNVLAGLYSIDTPRASAKDGIRIDFVGLANDPTRMRTDDSRMKAFFNSDTDNEEIYAELFINVIQNMKVLQFHEKDSDYRGPLMKALSGES